MVKNSENCLIFGKCERSERFCKIILVAGISDFLINRFLREKEEENTVVKNCKNYLIIKKGTYSKKGCLSSSAAVVLFCASGSKHVRMNF